MFKTGSSYLIVGGNVKPLFYSYCKSKSNRNALFVWRDHPRELTLAQEKAANTIWITNIDTKEKHINPNDIEMISYFIENFIKKKQSSLVVLSCVEYLISYNLFNDVLHMIQTLKDLTADKGAILLIFVGKDTLEEQEENLLRNELINVGDADEINWIGN
jgi:hypothetical protein